MKTIKQIADEIGVSKQAIQKRIAREPLYTSLSPYISTENGTKYIDIDGETLIKSAFDKKIDTDGGDNIHIDVANNDVHSQVIKILQEQLKIKDVQIESLQEELRIEREHSRQQSDKLAELARNSQVLLSTEQNRATHLLGSVEGNDTTPQKKPFFSRFFKK